VNLRFTSAVLGVCLTSVGCGGEVDSSDGEPQPATPEPSATYVGVAPGALGEDGMFPSVALDANGTVHMLFRGAQRAPVYAECAQDCTSHDRWRSTAIGEGIASVSPLALDSRHRPRFVLTRPTPNLPDYLGSDGTFSYASCDANCLTSSSWTVTELGRAPALPPFVGVVDQVPDPMVGISLDDDDRAWVAVFTDDAQPSPSESTASNPLTLTSCAGNCADVSNWTQATHSVPGHGPVFLAVDAFGVAHIANGAYGGAPGENTWGHRVAYSEVDTLEGSVVSRVLDVDVDSYLGFLRLRVDAWGRPRMLYGLATSGGGNSGPLDRMVYAWCEEDCARGGTWSSVEIAVPGGAAQAQDFVLDDAGAPRIAYSTGNFDTLSYAFCTNHCNTPQATWTFQTMGTAADLLDSLAPSARMVRQETPCPGAPSAVMAVGLGLARDGTPRFADALHACGSSNFSVGFVAP
jgi:hypothetical protein